jgi:hypothetical protein
VVPQAPQLRPSVCVLTHWPEHKLVPAVQVHTPEVHDWPPTQMMSQPPQLDRSVVVLTQLPAQLVVPASHAQVPALQT